MRIQTGQLVALGYGRYVRSDDVVAIDGDPGLLVAHVFARLAAGENGAYALGIGGVAVVQISDDAVIAGGCIGSHRRFVGNGDQTDTSVWHGL